MENLGLQVKPLWLRKAQENVWGGCEQSKNARKSWVTRSQNCSKDLGSRSSCFSKLLIWLLLGGQGSDLWGRAEARDKGLSGGPTWSGYRREANGPRQEAPQIPLEDNLAQLPRLHPGVPRSHCSWPLWVADTGTCLLNNHSPLFPNYQKPNFAQGSMCLAKMLTFPEPFALRGGQVTWLWVMWKVCQGFLEILCFHDRASSFSLSSSFCVAYGHESGAGAAILRPGNKNTWNKKSHAKGGRTQWHREPDQHAVRWRPALTFRGPGHKCQWRPTYHAQILKIISQANKSLNKICSILLLWEHTWWRGTLKCMHGAMVFIWLKVSKISKATR